MGHKFHPEKAARLHAPERDLRQPWQPLLALLPLDRMTAVADLGAGTGYFTIPLARALAGRGRVYALDVQQEMLALLEARRREAGVENLEILRTEEPALPLPDASVDAVLLVNMLHEFDDLGASLREVRRILRPDGLIAVSDWKKIPTEEGPPVEERLSEEEALTACRAAGFQDLTLHPLYRDHYAFSGWKGNERSRD
jgi:ubiquinone/menaquinone biosynthesis C-methylase UbiE